MNGVPKSSIFETGHSPFFPPFVYSKHLSHVQASPAHPSLARPGQKAVRSSSFLPLSAGTPGMLTWLPLEAVLLPSSFQAATFPECGHQT